MNRNTQFAVMALSILASAGVGEAQATENNGFPVNQVYAVRDPNSGGQVRMYNKTDGTDMGNLLPEGSNWQTATFSGNGRGNDARFFVARAAGTDVLLAEIGPLGQTLRATTLGAILGGTVGPAVIIGNLRFSPVSNTLFLGLNPNSGASSTALAYEIDLALTTRIHTYQGESVPGSGGRRVSVAVNTRDGTLYMTAQNLGDTDASGLGNIIAFKTLGREVGGTTSTHTVLVNGHTCGVSGYSQPQSAIFRKRAGGDDTLIITTNVSSSATPALEFYLNTGLHPTGGAGNLAYRGSPISVARGCHGQQEPGSGEVWLGALRGGFHVVMPNDDVWLFETTSYWMDAAATPYVPCNEPFADIDGDGDIDQVDFGRLQTCFSGEWITAEAQCRCFDRDGDDAVDSEDLSAFIKCVTGPAIPWTQSLTPDCRP
jgi:hypothetical protein